jgi:NTE family protein
MPNEPDIASDQSPRGYVRSRALQAQFEQAAEALRTKDGYAEDGTGEPRLIADLALEGGGVKGIGLVGAVLVLDEAGYSFRAVAGTSAGAIAASLIAAISQANDPATHPMTDLRRYLSSLDFSKFMPEGPMHHFLDHHGGKIGSVVADAAILSHNMGLYSGDYLREWLAPIVNEQLGVRTFGDLQLNLPGDHPESLPGNHNYRLLVHTSDITRAELARLPWDYDVYGAVAADQDVVDAVRASMSIPFFFEPVTFSAEPANVDIPSPGGTVTQHFEGGTVTWVDGGMLRNFPIDAFDRADGGAPRWPTIGIKLSSLQTSFPATEACQGSAIPVAFRCLRTMMNEWDAYEVDEATAGRTIFVNSVVDGVGITATDFDLTSAQQTSLFINGVSAATRFIIEKSKTGVPRSAGVSPGLIRQARAL